MPGENSDGDYTDYRYWKSWSETSFGSVTADAAAYYSAELGCSGVANPAGLKVLELGFGNGSFAGWIKAQGAEYLGTEAIEELVASGLKAGYKVHHASEPLGDWIETESLDLVVAFDVFEHLPIRQLESLLDTLHTHMKNGAILLARMPSGDSPFSRAIQYGDLTHCTSLGSSASKQLAARTGFDVLEVRSPAVAWRGVGLKRAARRLFVESQRRIIYYLITWLLMGGGQPVLSPNMVFVWMKPSKATGRAAWPT